MIVSWGRELVLAVAITSLVSSAAQAQSITIGENHVESTGDSGKGNLLLAQNATLSQAATIKSLSFYVTQASGHLYLGIYDASGPNGGPGKLLAQTNRFTPIKGWNTYNVTAQASLMPATYWLAYFPSSNSLSFVKGLTSGVSNRYYHHIFGVMPASFSTSPSSNPYHWSFYATLTPTTLPPTLHLTLNPASPTISANAAIGTLLLTATASWRNGAPFTGTYSLSDPDGLFSMSGNQVIVAMPLPQSGATDNLTVTATQ